MEPWPIIQRATRKFDHNMTTSQYTLTLLLSVGADIYRYHHQVVETSLLEVFDQPLHGLLESVFLRGLYLRLALYMGAE